MSGRSISVRGTTHLKLKAEADRQNVSMASLVTAWVEERLAQTPLPDYFQVWEIQGKQGVLHVAARDLASARSYVVADLNWDAEHLVARPAEGFATTGTLTYLDIGVLSPERVAELRA